MRRIVIATIAIAIAAAPAFAQSGGMGRHHGHDAHQWDKESLQYTIGAMEEFFQANADRPAGELTFSEYQQAAAELSIAQQKDEYLSEVRMRSFLMPGSGHFKVDREVRGLLFGATGLAMTAGTLVTAYYLLPDELKFDELNYITESFSEIETAWEAQSIETMWPAFATMAGGMLVKTVVRIAALYDAGKIAEEQIESGQKTFQPEPFLMMAGTVPMMGMRIEY